MNRTKRTESFTREINIDLINRLLFYEVRICRSQSKPKMMNLLGRNVDVKTFLKRQYLTCLETFAGSKPKMISEKIAEDIFSLI